MIAQDASSDENSSPNNIDKLLAYVNEQIELLAFDDPDPAVLKKLIEGLADSRQAIRLDIIEALAQIGEPATPFLLDELTHNPEMIVRKNCCHAISNIGDPMAVSGLVQTLRYDENIVVKGAAASALASIGEPAFEPLCKVLASETADESGKGQAAWAIASMASGVNSSEISQQLYRSIHHPSSTVRTAIIGAIAQLARKKDPNAPEAMRQALSDPSAEVRIEAAADLARLNVQDAYQTLVDLLTDPDAEVRKSVVLALSKFNRADTVEAIAPLTQDPSPQVQRVATLVIEQLQAQTAP